MSSYPYTPIRVHWKRPQIDRELLVRFMRRSDLHGLWHSLGVLAILGASGAVCYWFYSTGQWLLMALALYVHGGLFAFNPQTHELSHRTMFRTRWLNNVFGRIFGLVHWNSNLATYRMSHKYHHRYTLHRRSEGERVHPKVKTTEQVVQQAFQVVDISALVTTLYDQVYAMFRPYLSNPRRSVWQRYVYEQATERERREADRRQVTQFLLHVAFAVFAIAIGQWFLIVVVSLPRFYGARWYHTLVHATMHVGREPEADDFRKSCRSVKVDPFTSFLYWHMEWHTEHHTFPAVPCYRLRKFHEATREHWEPPQPVRQAWQEMNAHSAALLSLAARPIT